jgi:hypothetical protein
LSNRPGSTPSTSALCQLCTKWVCGLIGVNHCMSKCFQTVSLTCAGSYGPQDSILSSKCQHLHSCACSPTHTHTPRARPQNPNSFPSCSSVCPPPPSPPPLAMSTFFTNSPPPSSLRPVLQSYDGNWYHMHCRGNTRGKRTRPAYGECLLQRQHQR